MASRFFGTAVTTAVLGVALAFRGTVAQAQTSITPGQTNVVVPTTAFFGGTQQGTTQTATYTATNAGSTITGRLLSSVFLSGTGNTGALDFYYQLFLDSGNTQDQNLSIANFAGAATSIGQTNTDIDGAGPYTAGGTASPTANRGNNGGGIIFDFGAGVPVAGFSQTLLVRTNATAFSNNGGASVQSTNGVAANTTGTVIAAISNGATAPEPGSIALLGTGALSLGGMLIRRRRNAA